VRPPDQPIREAALEAAGSFHLESPAGSGKTTLLAARYLLLLAAGEPEEVLAVTFTRKAAGELRERILTAIATALRGASPPNAADAQLAELARAVAARHGLAPPGDDLPQPVRLAGGALAPGGGTAPGQPAP
jgi:ATP-dependent exoDNAse (exonuclease V) beta subunit